MCNVLEFAKNKLTPKNILGFLDSLALGSRCCEPSTCGEYSLFCSIDAHVFK